MRRDTTDWNLPATLIGSTPYLLAARFLEAEIMPVLVAAGADPSLTHAEWRGRGDAGGRNRFEPDREPAWNRDHRFRQGRTGKPRAGGGRRGARTCAATSRPRARRAIRRCTSLPRSDTTPSCSFSWTAARGSTSRTPAASRRCARRCSVQRSAEGAPPRLPVPMRSASNAPIELAHPSTVAVLRALGATE